MARGCGEAKRTTTDIVGLYSSNVYLMGMSGGWLVPEASWVGVEISSEMIWTEAKG